MQENKVFCFSELREMLAKGVCEGRDLHGSFRSDVEENLKEAWLADQS